MLQPFSLSHPMLLLVVGVGGAALVVELGNMPRGSNMPLLLLLLLLLLVVVVVVVVVVVAALNTSSFDVM